jgi:hypothetical protein
VKVFFAISAHFRSTGISTRQHTCEIGVQKRGPPFRGDRHLAADDRLQADRGVLEHIPVGLTH